MDEWLTIRAPAFFTQLAMKACPYRRDFYAKLAADPDGSASVAGDNVNKELDKWLHGLNMSVDQMQKLYKQKGYGKI